MSGTSMYDRFQPSRVRSWSHRARLLLLLLIVTLLASALGHPASAASTEPRVLPQLHNEASAQPNKDFRVIVTRHNNSAGADEKVKTLGGTKLKDLPTTAFVATVKGKAIAALGADPSVAYVAPDAVMVKTGGIDTSKLGTLYPITATASTLWSSTGSGSGLTGAGVGVAVLDTGIRGRPDFMSIAGNNRVVTSARFNPNAKSTVDAHGHGTHVAGIIAGNSWHQKDGTVQGKYVGIAPEANLINLKVSDDTGMSYLSNVVDAIEWAITNRQTYNIRVMNLSLVSSVAESAKTSVLAAAVERAWFNGIFVVVAAGNGGANTMYYPPANDPFVVTVGAADPMGTAGRGDDTIAPWSSYGTTQDGVSKPDVVAPGRNIVAPLALSSTVGQTMPDRIVDNQYIRLSGTSMATPMVAGLAALAFQAHPEWTNDQVKWLLLNRSSKLGPPTSPLPGQGAGEINAAAVVTYTGTPGYANQNLTINQQLVTPAGATTYTSASWSAASWSAASWSAASWSAASWSAASWSAASWSTSSFVNTTERDVQ